MAKPDAQTVAQMAAIVGEVPRLDIGWRTLVPNSPQGFIAVQYLCPVCSAWVDDPEQHRNWHVWIARAIIAEVERTQPEEQ